MHIYMGLIQPFFMSSDPVIRKLGVANVQLGGAPLNMHIFTHLYSYIYTQTCIYKCKYT